MLKIRIKQKSFLNEAAKGWGPMLYDVAMEWATMNGGGLTPDRDIVTGAARNVWDYYFHKRNDVEAIQMDNPQNVLTPPIEDNCGQSSSSKDGYFTKSPLSNLTQKSVLSENLLEKKELR